MENPTHQTPTGVPLSLIPTKASVQKVERTEKEKALNAPNARLDSSKKVRKELTWLYNKFKQRVWAAGEWKAEDVKTMALLLRQVNDVLQNAILEGRMREMEQLLADLESGKEITPETVKRVIGSKAFQQEDGDEDEEEGERDG